MPLLGTDFEGKEVLSQLCYGFRVSFSFAILVAVPLGTLAAWKSGSLIDRFVMMFSVGGFSIPVFVLGYILIYILAMELKWLPVQGYKSMFEFGTEGGERGFLFHVKIYRLGIGGDWQIFDIGYSIFALINENWKYRSVFNRLGGRRYGRMTRDW